MNARPFSLRTIGKVKELVLHSEMKPRYLLRIRVGGEELLMETRSTIILVERWSEVGRGGSVRD